MRSYALLCGLVAAIAAGLFAYSQTIAFAWDEGFHLLAAQLIRAGRRPYLDFVFSQTPLNAYWNAAWMALGESWRVAHGAAALATGLAIFGTADYLFRYHPLTGWRMPGAVAGALLCGLNGAILEFGTIGQAYGLCLLLIVVAFRCAVASVTCRSWVPAFAAGLASAAAANSSLLTAPVAPVLLAWSWAHHQSANRWTRSAAFVAGAAIACVPLLLLWIQSPRQVVFGVFEYNFRYRGVRWDDATPHNVGVMMAWIHSLPALALVLLVAAAIPLIRTLPEPQRRDFKLCAWLAAALCIHISTAHPTFERYYLFLVPFLAILASAGLHWLASKLQPSTAGSEPKGVPAVGLLAFLLCVSMGKTLSQSRDDFRWSELESVASQVARVTPPGAPLAADEHIYFLLDRVPPQGMELADSHKLEFPPSVAGPLHVVPEPDLIRRIQAGEFKAVQTCDDGQIDKLGLPRVFSQQWRDSECAVFWDPTP